MSHLSKKSECCAQRDTIRCLLCRAAISYNGVTKTYKEHLFNIHNILFELDSIIQGTLGDPSSVPKMEGKDLESIGPLMIEVCVQADMVKLPKIQLLLPTPASGTGLTKRKAPDDEDNEIRSPMPTLKRRRLETSKEESKEKSKKKSTSSNHVIHDKSEKQPSSKVNSRFARFNESEEFRDGSCFFECKICFFYCTGKSTNFWAHAYKKHNINTKDYKSTFGDPCIWKDKIKCAICLEKLGHDHEAIKSHAKLHRLSIWCFYEKCYEAEKSSSTKLQVHGQRNSDMKKWANKCKYKCRICNKTYKNHERFFVHIKKHDMAPKEYRIRFKSLISHKKTIVCLICQKTLLHTHANLRLHTARHGIPLLKYYQDFVLKNEKGALNNLFSKEDQDDPPESKESCDFNDKKNYRVNLWANKSSITCNFCEWEFGNMDEARSHVITNHCDGVKEKFYKMEKPLRVSEKFHDCKLCKRQIKWQKRHLEGHFQKKHNKMTLCNYYTTYISKKRKSVSSKGQSMKKAHSSGTKQTTCLAENVTQSQPNDVCLTPEQTDFSTPNQKDINAETTNDIGNDVTTLSKHQSDVGTLTDLQNSSLKGLQTQEENMKNGNMQQRSRKGQWRQGSNDATLEKTYGCNNSPDGPKDKGVLDTSGGDLESHLLEQHKIGCNEYCDQYVKENSKKSKPYLLKIEPTEETSDMVGEDVQEEYNNINFPLESTIKKVDKCSFEWNQCRNSCPYCDKNFSKPSDSSLIEKHRKAYHPDFALKRGDLRIFNVNHRCLICGADIRFLRKNISKHLNTHKMRLCEYEKRFKNDISQEITNLQLCNPSANIQSEGTPHPLAISDVRSLKSETDSLCFKEEELMLD